MFFLDIWSPSRVNAMLISDFHGISSSWTFVYPGRSSRWLAFRPSCIVSTNFPNQFGLLKVLRIIRVGYMSRKALPIKRNDAEPLTREDVQYDLLYHIFSDARTVFTSPLGKSTSEPPAKVHFCDLYVNALYKSSKCSKVLKDKMVETPMFAVELAKISLLTNVGRINTTMACKSSISSRHRHRV